MSIGIVTNFAKILSEAELDGMLTLKILTISLDTLDAELLRRVRHSVSLATIISNLVRLRVRARETGRELPYICLNAVIYYENMLDVIRLAHFAIENKIAQMQYTRMVNEAIAGGSQFPRSRRFPTISLHRTRVEHGKPCGSYPVRERYWKRTASLHLFMTISCKR